MLDDDEFMGMTDEFSSPQADGDIMAPIQCDEEDDGPDFTRMAKKKTADSTSSDANNASKAKKG